MNFLFNLNDSVALKYESYLNADARRVNLLLLEILIVKLIINN